MSFIVCLSHREDVDGILSAALIKAAFKSKRTDIVLADYANILSKLQIILEMAANSGPLPSTFNSRGSTVSSKKPKRLFICDLGLSKKTQDKFVSLVKEIISLGVKVTYFDHHDLCVELKRELRKNGVTLFHSVEECTSVQIFYKYKRKVASHAAFFAASAALTDYMEHRPLASVLASRWDRQFLMLEATVLSYIISANQQSDEFLVKAVDTLSKMKYPHEIEGGFATAERFAKKVAEGVEAIQRSLVTRKNVAYAHSVSDLSASVIVNFVLGISEKPVAMVYRPKNEINSYIISIRASKACKVHLGRIVNEVASSLGGTGGGHEKACGAMVPIDKLEEFIKSIDKRVTAIES